MSAQPEGDAEQRVQSLPSAKRRWEAPRVRPLGRIEELARGGGGKSGAGGDPGESRKPFGQG